MSVNRTKSSSPPRKQSSAPPRRGLSAPPRKQSSAPPRRGLSAFRKGKLELPAFTNGDLIAGASLDGNAIAVHFNGNADLSAKARMDTFFAKLHTEALRLTVSEVSVDLRKLEFMNSSCLKAVTTWLLAVEEVKPMPYSIRFMTNASHWQTRSLQALKYFAPGIVRIDTPPIV